MDENGSLLSEFCADHDIYWSLFFPYIMGLYLLQINFTLQSPITVVISVELFLRVFYEGKVKISRPSLQLKWNSGQAAVE